jgi:hypothetical protein
LIHLTNKLLWKTGDALFSEQMETAALAWAM